MYHLTFIQVHRFSFHIHPGCVWIPSRPPRLTSHIHPGCVSPQSRSRYLHLTSIEVTSYFYPDPENCISSPPRFHLKPIPVLINSIHGLPHLQRRPKTSCLTYIHVPTNHIPCPMSPIHLGCISTQSRSLYLSLTSIYVTPHFHPGPQIRISIPHLQFKCWELPPASVSVTYHVHQGNVMLVVPKSTQFSWFASHLH